MEEPPHLFWTHWRVCPKTMSHNNNYFIYSGHCAFFIMIMLHMFSHMLLKSSLYSLTFDFSVIIKDNKNKLTTEVFLIYILYIHYMYIYQLSPENKPTAGLIGIPTITTVQSQLNTVFHHMLEATCILPIN